MGDLVGEAFKIEIEVPALVDVLQPLVPPDAVGELRSLLFKLGLLCGLLTIEHIITLANPPRINQ